MQVALVLLIVLAGKRHSRWSVKANMYQAYGAEAVLDALAEYQRQQEKLGERSTKTPNIPAIARNFDIPLQTLADAIENEPPKSQVAPYSRGSTRCALFID